MNGAPYLQTLTVLIHNKAWFTQHRMRNSHNSLAPLKLRMNQTFINFLVYASFKQSPLESGLWYGVPAYTLPT
jgi:hypothetical protein